MLGFWLGVGVGTMVTVCVLLGLLAICVVLGGSKND